MKTLSQRTCVLLITLVLSAGCAPALRTAAPSPVEATTLAARSADEGWVEGAEELAEPALQLAFVDTDGTIGLLDLTTEQQRILGQVGAPTAMDTDGRFLFVSTADGLQIVDTGTWTVDHGDHVHYYRAPSRIVGTVPGAGPALVRSSDSMVVVRFADAQVVVLDKERLGQGELQEAGRFTGPAGPGPAAPVGDMILLADETALRAHTYDGAAVPGITAPCAATVDARRNRVGTVFSCAAGAVLATEEDNTPVLTTIDRPAAGPTPGRLDNRIGRPTVAAVAGQVGFWLLDTRAQEWELVPTPRPLLAVTAIDDADDHTVAVDVSGRLLVHRSGSDTTETAPLIDPSGPVSVVADADRAYLADGSGTVHEIDYKDDARLARSFTLPFTPRHLTETGR